MADDGSRPTGKSALGADLVIPALAVAFVAYLLSAVWDKAWEAKANGLVVGTALLVLIALQLVRAARAVVGGKADLRLDPLFLPVPVLARRLALVALVALFVALLPWLGVTLGLFLMLLLGMAIMGVRNPRVLVGVSLAAAAAVYLLFVAFLGVRYPAGPVEELIGWLVRAGG
jgi:hypothetical protein